MQIKCKLILTRYIGMNLVQDTEARFSTYTMPFLVFLITMDTSCPGGRCCPVVVETHFVKMRRSFVGGARIGAKSQVNSLGIIKVDERLFIRRHIFTHNIRTVQAVT